MRKKKKRGRPEYKPTGAVRLKVSIAAGGGMPHEEIAIGLGISRNTLEKHFQHELSVGANERRLEVLEAMHKAATKRGKGNVAAQKAYLAMTPAAVAPPLPKEPKPEPLGKKEQANVDAKTAQEGTAWSELLPRPPNAQLQ